jgi:hypothetical protein
LYRVKRLPSIAINVVLWWAHAHGAKPAESPIEFELELSETESNVDLDEIP